MHWDLEEKHKLYDLYYKQNQHQSMKHVQHKAEDTTWTLATSSSSKFKKK